MAKIVNLFLILLFCHQIIATSSKQIYPDFYKISYKSTQYPNIPGIYSKQDYEHNGGPVFKKTGRSLYCLYVNDDGNWTLGLKYTRGEEYKDILSMRDANNDLPTKGDWIVQTAVGGSTKVEVTVKACSHPDLYVVHSPTYSYLVGFYLQKDQTYQSFPVFKKRAYSDGAEYVLFLHSDGLWKFGRGTSATSGVARSLEKGLPTPGLSKSWKIWDSGSWKTGINFTVSPLNPEYPASYTVSYHGEDKEISEKIQKVLGIYEKQNNLQDGVPLYKNLDTKFNIFRSSNGRWNIENNEYKSYSLYQESNDSPILLQDQPWNLSKTKQNLADFIVIPNHEKKITRADTENESETTESEPEMRDTESKENKGKSGMTEPEPELETISIEIILGIISGVIVLVVLIVVAIAYRKQKGKAKAEEPKIDENMYYGVDYNDNDDDNAITDTNDYYD